MKDRYIKFCISAQFLICMICFLFYTSLLYGETKNDYSAFRLLSTSAIPAKNVSFEISFGNLLEKEGEPFIPLVCEMDAHHDYSYVVVSMSISREGDTSSPLPIRTEQVISLVKGYNRSMFLLPLNKLDDGIYSGDVQVKYTKEEKPAIVNFKMEKISSLGLEGQLNLISTEIEQTLSTGEKRVDKVRCNLIRDLLIQAREEFNNKHWEDLSDTLIVLQGELTEIKNSSMRGDVLSESFSERDVSLSISSEGVMSDGKPINLVGVYLNEPTLDVAKKLVDYAIPFVVMQISLATLFPTEGIDEALATSITEVLDYLFTNKIYVIVQINQQQLPPWFYEKNTEINKDGFVNLAQRPVWDLIERGCSKIIHYCEATPFLLGVSFLNEPKFKFDGEEIRKSFIEWVKVNYPDRQTLNQIWHAHLANYDEITIWDEVAPKWSYQNRRAYQYDWHNFHREMITNLLKGSIDYFHRVSEKLPVSITFASQVFELDETKFTPDRERIIPNIDFVSLNVTFSSEDAVYAQCYPDPVVDIVWMRSVSKDKPIVISCANLNYKEGMTQSEKYRHTQSFLWESILSGAQLVALNITGDLRDNVAVWKAIVDTNSLFKKMSSELRKFQTMEPDVRILFSDSSKILDGGVPHLKSARLAYEGSSFSGYDVCFATEKEIEAGILQNTKVLIMPQTLSLEDDVFNMITDFIRNGNYVIRVGTQIPYDPKGVSRRDVVQPTSNTVLVRGMNLPTEYLHGMDAVISKKSLPPLPRPVNKAGYPLEGVKSRFIPSEDGGGYLYILNLRREDVLCRLTGYLQKGINLLDNTEVEFPIELKPLDLLFIKMVPPQFEKILSPDQKSQEKVDKRKRK